MKKVLVFGSFDILHPGHHNLFQQAKHYGDTLYVVIARDKTIEKVKARTPIHNELKRKEAVEKIDIVDKVLLGNLDDPYAIIEQIKPDAICLGYDQISFTQNLEQELKQRNLSPQIIRLKPFKPEEYKSSRFRT